MEHDLPIGLAPNIHVSLVMLPEEARLLQDDPNRFRFKEWKLAAKRQAFRAKFALEQRAKRRAFAAAHA
jgi:hypothetical protein